MVAEQHGSGEFKSWRSYLDFRREVARDWRYVRSETAQTFLDAVAAGSHSRAVDIPAKSCFYRAQVAHADDPHPEIGETSPAPAESCRMTPLPDRAMEGRVNPKGVPCLYMASDTHTAMAEVRPWVGSLVSVGVFQTVHALKIVDCANETDPGRMYINHEPSVEKRAQAVWNDIARAFREPVTRDDDVADYAATQVIAEVFRKEGFDGVGYGSAFGTGRFNIALFDLNAARLVKCSLHEIRNVELKFEETANPYYVE